MPASMQLRDESGASLITIMISVALLTLISMFLWKSFSRNGRVQMGAKSSASYTDFYDGGR